MPDFSIVTLVKGRRKQLSNLLDSICKSTLMPNDVQIVCMDDPRNILIPPGLNVEIHWLEKGDNLPLAAARNMGFDFAKTNRIIFIDADCIVSPTLFGNMLLILSSEKIISAYPLYLTEVPGSGDFIRLKSHAVSHPARKDILPGLPVDHLQFWSLIFAIEKKTFKKIGGFDVNYHGYGAEDTDFAMSFNRAGFYLQFVSDYVLHQYHHKYNPPVNYFNSIIDNANYYKKKWKVLPMYSWLKAFQKLDLINITESNDIIIIRQPSDDLIKKSISLDPY
ncbi:glycosyltransferase family 2 protein [Pedobacter aquatilis]|uniref:glycosyltransferase family 2 protein n=1 Tax=Pedobacter aquatilis TaxID=351343 RepID=UPI00293019AF|nr:galactosyltransferase-related protein [Pedobacter aquatilis]